MFHSSFRNKNCIRYTMIDYLFEWIGYFVLEYPISVRCKNRYYTQSSMVNALSVLSIEYSALKNVHTFQCKHLRKIKPCFSILSAPL